MWFLEEQKSAVKDEKFTKKEKKRTRSNTNRQLPGQP